MALRSTARFALLLCLSVGPGLAAGRSDVEAAWTTTAVAPGPGPVRGPVSERVSDCVNDRVRGDELSVLRTALRDSNKFVRKDAVEDLAERSEVEAWELLVEALEDGAGEVADSAAHHLERLPAGPGVARGFARLHEDLLGDRGLTARDVQVRRYAAELLGRTAATLDGHALERGLRDDDAVVRRLTAWTIQRAAAGGRLEEDRDDLTARLGRVLARDDDPLVRARALHALVTLGGPQDEPVASLVASAARDGSAEVRAAAAVLLGTAGVGGRDGGGANGAPLRSRPRPETHSSTPGAGRAPALALLASLAADPAVPVRTAAIDALVGTARGAESGPVRGAAASLLVERLAVEDVPILARRLLAGLRGLSGMKYGGDVRPWRDWVGALDGDWRGAPAAENGSDEVPGGGRTATLVGLPIRSRSVAFLIDFSGSAWREREDGRTVKEVLDERLREALEALPADTRFLLVPFTGEPHPWRDELTSATPRNVAKALRWFEDARYQGTGNAWDAMVLAHDVPGVDTLVLLSDGAPSGGARYRLERIAAMFAERNLGRQAVLDCVLVDTPRRLQRLWGDLAAATGGTALAVDLDEGG